MMFGESRSAIRASKVSSCAPARSILLTKMSVGTPSRCRALKSTRVCARRPSTAEMTSTAPSSRASTRSTSAIKSGWPGVSIRLTVVSPMANETTAARIVMPRARSSAKVSVCVLPASTLPTASMTPASKSRRSVRVVLPASTCASIPRFKHRIQLHDLTKVEALRVHDGRLHAILRWVLGGHITMELRLRQARRRTSAFGRGMSVRYRPKADVRRRPERRPAAMWT